MVKGLLLNFVKFEIRPRLAKKKGEGEKDGYQGLNAEGRLAVSGLCASCGPIASHPARSAHHNSLFSYNM